MMFRLTAEFGAVYINTDQIAMITEYEEDNTWEVTMSNNQILNCSKDIGEKLVNMRPMNPMTMIGVREVIENYEYTHLPCYIKGCVNGPENHQWNDECQTHGQPDTLENHEYTSIHSCSDGCVHVDWHMTPDEWSELRRVLNDADIPYIQSLKAAGNL